MKYFDETFWKMALGFIAVIIVAVGLIFAVGMLS